MPPLPPEIEIKIALHRASDGFALIAALPVSSRGPESVVRVRDLYLDTAEHDLLNAGYAFRLRTTDGDSLEATLKSMSPTDDTGVAVREERTVSLDAPLRDPRLLPDGALRRLVTSIVGRRPLVPLARVAGMRTKRRLRVDADLVAEASVDRVVVSAAGRSTPVIELEVERTKGDEATFRAWLERAWRDRRVKRGGSSKLGRALSLARIAVPSAVRVAAARLSLEEIGPSTPSTRAGARDLARTAADLERAIAGAHRGSIEGVHDARTLSRRLRAVLAFHAPDVDDSLIEDARVRLRALRRAAGPVRELDVLADALRRATLPSDLEKGRAILLDAARTERVRKRIALSKALASPRLASLASKWARPAEELSRRTSIPFALSAALRLPKSLEAPLSARRAIVGPISDASAPRIHATRIAAKRARYAVDACLPALGKPAKRFARHLRVFVDEAGSLRDAEVHGASIRALVRSVPSLAGERAAAERTAAVMSEQFDAVAARARRTLDRLFDAALGPEAVRDLLEHLSKRAASAP